MYHEEERPILWFDSIAEHAAYADANIGENLKRTAALDAEWSGMRGTWKDLVELAKFGSEEGCEEAMKMLEKFDLSSETTGRHYEPNVCGAYPIVPEFLASQPANMRAMISKVDDCQPIRVFVGTTSSAGCSVEQLTIRGIAILALIMSIAKVRPVELYMCTPIGAVKTGNGEDYAMTVARINTSPLDISSAAFALVGGGYSRGISYKTCEALHDGIIRKPNGWRYVPGSYGSWGHVRCKDGKIRGDYTEQAEDKYIERMREILGMEEQDIYVPCITIAHREQIVNDPVGWVKQQLVAANLLDNI